MKTLSDEANAILEGGFLPLSEAIRNAPSTWIPALLIVCVEAGLAREVFNSGGAAEIAKRTEGRWHGKDHP